MAGECEMLVEWPQVPVYPGETINNTSFHSSESLDLDDQLYGYLVKAKLSRLLP